MIEPSSRKYVVTIAVKILVVLFSFTGQSSGTEYEMHMTPASHCPGQVISWAHRYRTVEARSVLECATYCRPDIECVSVTFDMDNKVCYFGNSTVDVACSNTIPGSEIWKYYEKRIGCENGGNLSADGQNCTCPDGYYGSWCEVAPRDCEEYFHKGLLTTRGVYFVKPPKASIPFQVYCDYLIPYNVIRTRMAVRNDLVISFNRSWQEYLEGFGTAESKTHYWLGLQKIHLLTTSKKYQLRFRVAIANVSYLQYYSNFVLNDETSGFSMSVDIPAPTMPLGDCLQDLVGAPFSTYDVDNDGSSVVNCAQQHGGGWWFKGDNCSSCNPFGPILSPYDGVRKGVEGEAFWTLNLGNHIPFSLLVYLVPMP